MAKWGATILRSIWAPTVFTVLPILYLLYRDLFTVFLWEIIAPFLLAIFITGLIFFSFFLFSRKIIFASILSSLVILGFYIFGLIEYFVAQIELGGISNYLSIVILNFTIFILAYKALSNFKFSKVLAAGFNFLANLILCSFLLAYGYRYFDHEHDLTYLGGDISEDIIRPVDGAPNIYYILVHGLGRLDVLREGFGIDVSDFESVLKRHGFFISANTRANYTDFHSSISASLNMSYLNDWIKEESKNNIHPELIKESIQLNKLVPILRTHGYKIITLSPSRADVDLLVSDERTGTSVFHYDLLELLLEHTPINFILDQASIHHVRNERYYESTLEVLKKLPELASSPGQKFIIAEILSPAPPFVFNSDGSLSKRAESFSSSDGSDYIGEKGAYMAKYSHQSKFLLAQLAKIMTVISRKDPLAHIVVQSTHGSSLQYHQASITLGDPSERLAIFSAYRLGGLDPKDVGLDHNVSPVNTFRIVLNGIFGANLPILDNRSYFSPSSNPMSYKEIPEATPRILTCRPSPSGRVGRIGQECLEPYPKEQDPASSTLY